MKKTISTDELVYDFFCDNEHFACFINTVLFAGRKILDPNDLQEVDTRSGIQRRDILKLWQNKHHQMYFGIENQLKIHNYMPLRNRRYDDYLLYEQIKIHSKRHRQTKDLKKEDFLSGINRDDKLIPVITFTIYYGEDEWDKPIYLSDLFISSKIDFSKQDYMMRLESVRDTKDNQYYDEDVQTVFHMCALIYKEDYETIQKKYNRMVSKDLAKIIFSITDTKEIIDIILKEETEELNMCKAMERFALRNQLEGKEKGRIEGRMDALLNVAKDLVSKGFSDEMILSIQGITTQILFKAKQLMEN